MVISSENDATGAKVITIRLNKENDDYTISDLFRMIKNVMCGHGKIEHFTAQEDFVDSIREHV